MNNFSTSFDPDSLSDKGFRRRCWWRWWKKEDSFGAGTTKTFIDDNNFLLCVLNDKFDRFLPWLWKDSLWMNLYVFAVLTCFPSRLNERVCPNSCKIQIDKLRTIQLECKLECKFPWRESVTLNDSILGATCFTHSVCSLSKERVCQSSQAKKKTIAPEDANWKSVTLRLPVSSDSSSCQE